MTPTTGPNRRSALLWAGAGLLGEAHAQTARNTDARLAPDFQLPYLPSATTADASARCSTSSAPAATACSAIWRGQWLYLDFWASWCGPCKLSFPWMNQLQREWAPKGLQIVAINLDSQRDKAIQFLQRHPAQFTVLWDAAGHSAKAYDVQAMPMSYLIDPQGHIVSAHRGFTEASARATEMDLRKRLVAS
jgi:cytochrome c biogenesis protein CcmG, thiol:disulfide interchange protein DsbE